MCLCLADTKGSRDRKNSDLWRSVAICGNAVDQSVIIIEMPAASWDNEPHGKDAHGSSTKYIVCRV